MWYPDLGTRAQVAAGPHVRAIGWLSAKHDYPRGTSPPAFQEKLRQFAKQWMESVVALEWPVAHGAHVCELCSSDATGGNFGVPAGDILYVCPEMVWHYVTTHDYLPPKEFIDAVLDAPLPRERAYAGAVAAFRPPSGD